MKALFCICLLFSSTFLRAQVGASYLDLLNKTSEITIVDSFLVETATVELTAIDTLTLLTFFQSIYPPLNAKGQNTTNYFISGKITSNPNFDMLLVTTRRETDDNGRYESVYLLTKKKDGSNISILSLALRREKESMLHSYAWMHKDNRIFVSTNVRSMDKISSGIMEYRISNDGFFEYYPHRK